MTAKPPECEDCRESQDECDSVLYMTPYYFKALYNIDAKIYPFSEDDKSSRFRLKAWKLHSSVITIPQ